MWLKKVSYNITEKNKFLLVAGTILMIIILIMSIESISLYSSYANEKIIKAVNQQMYYASKNVDIEINSYARVLLTMYIDKSLHQIITDDNSIFPQKFEYFDKRISSINSYLNALISGLVYRPELNLYLISEYQPYDITSGHVSSTSYIINEPWYQKAQGNRKFSILWNDFETEDENGNLDHTLTATIAIRDFANSPKTRIAFAHLSQNMQWLDASMKNTLDLDNGVLYILNHDDRIIYSSDGHTNLPDELLQKIDDHDIAHDSSGYQFIGSTRATQLVYYYHNMKMDWQLIYLTDNNIFSDNTYIIEKFILIAILPIILLSLLLLIVSSKFLTDRLVRLKTAVETIDEEHLELSTNLVGNDEVGVLAESFQKVLGMIRNLLEKNRIIEREKYITELQILQERANPHFLYNTLSSISAMAMDIDAYDISNALACLADFYRLSLSHGEDIITISEELNMLHLYINTCRMRFGDRIKISIDIPNEFLDYLIPKLILQPFIENSILHGLRSDAQKEDQISISAVAESEAIIFTISDNGIGIKEEQLQNITNKQPSDDSYHAIKSINTRIKLHFGDKYGVQINSSYNFGTTVVITIPKMSPGFIAKEDN